MVIEKNKQLMRICSVLSVLKAVKVWRVDKAG